MGAGAGPVAEAGPCADACTAPRAACWSCSARFVPSICAGLSRVCSGTGVGAPVAVGGGGAEAAAAGRGPLEK